MKEYLILIPAYNESTNITSVISGIRGLSSDFDILVINDGSNDDTSEVASKAGAMVINLPVNIGYGGALQTGFRFAVDRGYEYVITMDADTQHDPISIPTLIDTIIKEEADVVIGSRFLGHSNYSMEFLRKVGVLLFSMIARVYTGIKITDPTSGFQILRRNVFSYLAQRDNYPLDYPDVNIIMALHKKRFKIVEAPVVMRQKSCKKSMHSGLKPFLYVVRMFIAILIVLIRRDEVYDK